MPFYWPKLLVMAAFHDRGNYKSRIFLLSSGYFALSLSVAFHKVTVSPSAVDLKEIEALALFYRPKLSIMAAKGISKPSDRGGLRRANKNIVYASRNVPLQGLEVCMPWNTTPNKPPNTRFVGFWETGLRIVFV